MTHSIASTPSGEALGPVQRLDALPAPRLGDPEGVPLRGSSEVTVRRGLFQSKGPLTTFVEGDGSAGTRGEVPTPTPLPLPSGRMVVRGPGRTADN